MLEDRSVRIAEKVGGVVPTNRADPFEKSRPDADSMTALAAGFSRTSINGLSTEKGASAIGQSTTGFGAAKAGAASIAPNAARAINEGAITIFHS